MNRTASLIVGLIVGIAVTFAVMTSTQRAGESSMKKISGYEVVARFDNVGHLAVGSRVTAGGVAVGQVRAIEYDFEAYEAVVTMVIEHQYDRFPTDTSASILTTGLTGPQYVGLQPGADDRSLRDGDQLDITSSALILEQIIGQFLYNMAQDDIDQPKDIGPAVSGPGF